jgi:hypothetical protein
LGGNFNHIDVEPDCYSKLGPYTIWLTEGMAGVAASTLVSVLTRYGLDPTRFEFLNSLLNGAANFEVCYGTEADITPDLTLEEKVHRVRNVMGLGYLTDEYYAMFNPEHREYFKSTCHPHLEEEMRRVQSAGHSFAHEKDVFALETRVHRLSLQYNLYRYFYHDHQALVDDVIVAVRNRWPMNWQVERKLYRRTFQLLIPNLAAIEYQKTGANLFSEPNPKVQTRLARHRRLRYLVGRATQGLVNLDNPNTYVHPDNWYRRFRANRRFFESILLDERTANRGYYDMAVVRTMLKKQARGSSLFGPLDGLVTFELFNRYFIDGEAAPALGG